MAGSDRAAKPGGREESAPDQIEQIPEALMEDQHSEKPGNEADDRKFHKVHCGLRCQSAVPRHAYWIPKRAGMTMPV